MPPTFLKVLNFLPEGSRNSSSSLSSLSSSQRPKSRLLTRQVDIGDASKQQDNQVKHISTTSPTKQQSSPRLSISSLKHRLGRTPSMSSVKSCPPSPPPSLSTSTLQKDDFIISCSSTPSYQNEQVNNFKHNDEDDDDESDNASTVRSYHHHQRTATVETIIANPTTTGCTTPTSTPTLNEGSTANPTHCTAHLTQTSAKSFSTSPSFESFSSTISSTSSCSSCSSSSVYSYQYTENYSDNAKFPFNCLEKRKQEECGDDEWEAPTSSLESVVGGTAVAEVVGIDKNKDIHAHTDVTTARPLRLSCQAVDVNEAKTYGCFHCRHCRHADDDGELVVQLNKQPQNHQQLRKQMDCQRGETDNRQQKQQQQHEEEAHGLKTRYIFDSSSQALPQPLLNLHPFDMPPQEHTPLPGINNGKPWQTQHKAKTDEIQDPLKRFEIIERLGYGSSGSSIYKALDKSDNLKTVAIKKIPLSSLSDDCSEGDGSYNQQADVDYFVSCIADHSERWKVDDHQNSHYEEYIDDKRQNSHAKDMTGLDKIVQCLGVYQTDKELWHASTDMHVKIEGSWKLALMLYHHTIRPLKKTKQNKTAAVFVRKLRGRIWLSLEYCSGGSIEDLIRLSDGPLVESEVGWIMSQIIQGLSFLHSKDHVHGDIKASNILFTADGNVKLGGSGSILTHKEGAGESKRRRRSLTMIEFPTSWLAPESNPALPTTPCSTKQNQWIPNASASTDVWALGVACIELSQGKPPGPEMPILALFGERRLVGTPPAIPERRCDGSLMGNMKWDNLQQQTETFGAASMGMSEEMWSFIARCLTPDPEARPNVQELLEDPFIVRYSTPSTEFLERIHRMMEFVDQCTMISSDLTPYEPSSSSSQSPPSSSLTLSPSKASYMVDMKIDESCVEPWKIPMVRPRVDSVYDASSFFDEAGLPTTPPEPGISNNISGWKHQRVSHPVVKQALLCEQAGYMIFRHSRSPSLATIVESQLEEDKEVNLGPLNDFMNSPIIVKKVGLGPLDDLVIDHGGVCGTM